MSLTPEQREWVALLIHDVFTIPEGQDFNAEDSARLLEARIETLLRREREQVARAIEVERDAHWQRHLREHPLADWKSCPRDYGMHDAYHRAAGIARAETRVIPPAEPHP